MSKYGRECLVGGRILREFKKQQPGSPRFFVHILMLKKQLRRLERLITGQPLMNHEEIRHYFESEAGREALASATQFIVKAVRNHDKRQIYEANVAVSKVRKRAIKGRRLGVGYGQIHTPVSGGAVDSNRRRH